MSSYVANCPRCGAQEITFDVLGDVLVGIEYSWKPYFEIFARCRRCARPSMFEVALTDASEARSFTQSGTFSRYDGDLSPKFGFCRTIDISVTRSKAVPAHLPDPINAAFGEGARCLAVNCHNAAGAMFRLCLDLATKDRLPPEGAESEPSKHERRNLAPRLAWLFDHGGLPGDLKDLSAAVKGNGDDGAHDGTLLAAEAEDIYDFAFHLLERLYTHPARLLAASERREARKMQHDSEAKA